MYFLALESSCDETAAAVFTADRRVLANVVASQTDLHARFGGVVPEIASRAHLRNLLPVVEEALARAGITKSDIGCVAVHNTPGLVGSLLVGVSAAKMLALALGVPLVAVNHVAAHIYACRIAAERDIFPCLGLVVSGGHTALFDCESALSLQLLGGTRDDAAGEAFDKVAAILGLGFPGGPALEREAAFGNPTAYAFPRAFADDARLEFSFSGLKTAVLYACHGQNVGKGTPPPAGAKRADLAASFQAAVVDALVLKCKQALRKTGRVRLAVGGGVTANRALRDALQLMCEKEHAELFIPPFDLCTDNAAMAALAVEKWEASQFASPDLDAEPNFV
ncbi:MAG: tRNA (adenosine(37)-N6)-threonylcarbamoyltransferase complex transferase subunit TsaD [Bacteroidales bacterium]|nr:tRNA (adenosine(37)-N6)-threonylcarbamoyltransferase complex transferase subunit TsaD [Bacteroidales bacterium]